MGLGPNADRRRTKNFNEDNSVSIRLYSNDFQSKLSLVKDLLEEMTEYVEDIVEVEPADAVFEALIAMESIRSRLDYFIENTMTEEQAEDYYIAIPYGDPGA